MARNAIPCRSPAAVQPPAYTVLNGDSGVDNITGLNLQSRYLRLLGNRRATTCGYSLYKIEVFEPAAGAPTATASARLTPTTLRLYPNPVETELHLALPAGLHAHSVAVVDGLGRTVLREAAPDAAGLYLVQLTTADGRQFRQQFIRR